MKQTAVEWLMENLHTAKYPFTQAKEMEKQQIIDASNGYIQTEYLGVTKGEQYYNETYK